MTQISSLPTDTSPGPSNLLYTVRAATDYSISVSSLFNILVNIDHLTVQPASGSNVPLILKGNASQSANMFTCQNSSGSYFLQMNTSGRITTFASTGLNGAGWPFLVAYGRLSGTLAAGTTICTFTPSGSALFRIGWNVTATSQSASNLNINVTYTDNLLQSRNTFLFGETATTTSPALNYSLSNTVNNYIGVCQNIRSAANSAITIKTSGVSNWTYDVEAYIEQLTG